MLDNLLEIEVAYSLLKSGADETGKLIKKKLPPPGCEPDTLGAESRCLMHYSTTPLNYEHL